MKKQLFYLVALISCASLPATHQGNVAGLSLSRPETPYEMGQYFSPHYSPSPTSQVTLASRPSSRRSDEKPYEMVDGKKRYFNRHKYIPVQSPTQSITPSPRPSNDTSRHYITTPSATPSPTHNNNIQNLPCVKQLRQDVRDYQNGVQAQLNKNNKSRVSYDTMPQSVKNVIQASLQELLESIK